MTTRTGVVLFNLGGPDSLEAVEPFLFNLFNDAAIIRLPQPLRYAIARLISRRRAPLAKEIYAKIGGHSPILGETRKQADALALTLAGNSEHEFKIVVAMRYWHPRSEEAAQALAMWGADEIVLLPLYPQFSTTTTTSSLDDWARAAKANGLNVLTRAVCCWPTEPGLVESFASKIAAALATDRSLRVLFSAHGLPETIVRRGDPYPQHVEQTAQAVRTALARRGFDDIDSRICYQSRVGPLKWIGPSTDDEIRRAGRERKGIVMVPIAFVSEHSETLVELDIEYRHLAERSGVPRYERMATPGNDPIFIAGLKDVILSALSKSTAVAPRTGETPCADGKPCPCVRGF